MIVWMRDGWPNIYRFSLHRWQHTNNSSKTTHITNNSDNLSFLFCPEQISLCNTFKIDWQQTNSRTHLSVLIGFGFDFDQILFFKFKFYAYYFLDLKVMISYSFIGEDDKGQWVCKYKLTLFVLCLRLHCSVMAILFVTYPV